MSEDEPILPPCGHIDRQRQLTEIEVMATSQNAIQFLVCTVPGCPEYCRVFVDLRDPGDEPEGHIPPSDPLGRTLVGRRCPEEAGPDVA